MKQEAAEVPRAAQAESPAFTSGRGARQKPAEACYTAAAAALGLPPREVLLVGDDIVNDVTGPAATGMRSVWLDRLGTSPAPEGFPRITTLTELPFLLSTL